MENNTLVWLVDHKASLSESSPLNLDGSSWLTGVCVLSAETQDSAMAKFKSYLEKKELELIEIYEFAAYKEVDFSDDSKRTRQINGAVQKVRLDGQTCYVYARTSEYFDAMGGDLQND